MNRREVAELVEDVLRRFRLKGLKHGFRIEQLFDRVLEGRLQVGLEARLHFRRDFHPVVAQVEGLEVQTIIELKAFVVRKNLGSAKNRIFFVLGLKILNRFVNFSKL